MFAVSGQRACYPVARDHINTHRATYNEVDCLTLVNLDTKEIINLLTLSVTIRRELCTQTSRTSGFSLKNNHIIIRNKICDIF